MTRRLLAAAILGLFSGTAAATEPPVLFRAVGVSTSGTPATTAASETPAPGATPAATPAPAAAIGAAIDPSYLAELEDHALRERLYDARRWHLLLHDRPDGAGGFKSEVDGPKFFLAANGKRDPRAELLATLEAFFDQPASTKERPSCRFRARWKFLDESLHFDHARLPEPVCKDYETWRNDLDAGSITLIFASAFVGSPASTFGHTFLRIDKKSSDSPLLALGIEFAANPTTFNPILYTWDGLFGGFEGHFFSRPYFSKVQEYSNLEARDLWEYKLKLDDDQIDWALRHLWELDVTWFDYFFASENCSYQLLGVLDVAVPDAHLADRFPGATVPVDTVRVISDAGLVASRTIRPSQESVMLARRALLTKKEVRIAETIADPDEPANPPALRALAPDRQALVLDSAFDLFKHRYGFFGPRRKDPPAPVARREEALAFERGLIPVRGFTPAVAPKTPPESSHATARVGAGVAVSRDVTAEELWWRLSVHDLLDVQEGYPRDTQLEMLSGRVRVTPRRFEQQASGDAIVLDRLDLVRIVSVTPRDRWIHPVAWRVWYGGGRVPDLCDDRANAPTKYSGWRCTATDLDVGVGEAVGASFPFETVWYAFLDANPAAGPAFGDGWRVGGDLAAGTLWGITSWLRAGGEASIRWDPLGGPSPDTRFDPFFRAPSFASLKRARPNSRLEATLSLALGKNREIRAGGTWVRGQPELSATLFLLY